MGVGGRRLGEYECTAKDEPQYRYTEIDALFVNGYRMDEREDIEGRFAELHFGSLDDDIEVVSEI
jgi:hypothetical protein